MKPAITVYKYINLSPSLAKLLVVKKTERGPLSLGLPGPCCEELLTQLVCSHETGTISMPSVVSRMEHHLRSHLPHADNT